jgi:cyclic dehypoxanthinyl futalosine synthase
MYFCCLLYKRHFMQLNDLYQKALEFQFLTIEEGMYLFEHAPLTELMYVADELRKKQCKYH